jgi:hypothetical protein
MKSVEKANNLGNEGLSYGTSYATSGLKAYARSFEKLRSDIFFIQYASEILKTSDPKVLINDAIQNFTEIASYLFREVLINLPNLFNRKTSAFQFIQIKKVMTQSK